MKLRQASCLTLLLGLFVPSFAFAQATLAPIRDAKSGRIFAFEVKPTTSKSSTSSTQSVVTSVQAASISDSFIAANSAVLGVKNPSTDLVRLPLLTDQYGGRQKYLQQYKGIPVYTGELAVHMSPYGEVKYVKAKIANGLPLSVTPSISQASAKAAALKLAKREAGNTKIEVLTAQLLILPLGMVKNVAAINNHLAWKVAVVDSQPKGRDRGDIFSETYFIDAASGKKLLQLSGHEGLTRQIKDCADNSVNCQLDVQDPVYTGYYHGRSEGMPVRGPYPNPNKPVFYGSLDVDNLYDLISAVDAHCTVKFSSLGYANGPNGQGGTNTTNPALTKGLVHNDGSGFAPTCPYGALYSNTSGNITFCRKVVIPDVVAHEYGHALVAGGFPNGSPPTYLGESAVLNEAFADFMGEMFESAYSGSTDWKNTTANPTPPSPIRDLRNPPSLPQYTFGPPAPDRYYSSSVSCDGSDAGGAHYNSTVVSHAFYLISEGGQHNGCDIQGQGMDVAQRIFFRGWRVKFSSNPSFSEAYSDLIQACNDLYSPSVCAEVTKALQSVEMDQGGRCSAFAEVAPACAVQHVQNAYTIRPTYFLDDQGSPTSAFAPNETLRVVGFANMPNKPFKIYLRVHSASAPAIFADISADAFTESYTAASTTGPNGEVDVTLANPLQQSSGQEDYDLFIDGNNDGFWQPWADKILPIQIKSLSNGDGVCYKGQLYDTTENCMTAPLDCGCLNSGYQCQDISGGLPPGPYYYCVYNP